MARRIEVGPGFYLYEDVGHGGPLYLEEDEVQSQGRSEGQQRRAEILLSDFKTPFLKIVDEIVEMHNKKQQDYGSDHDPFANVRASADFGVPAWVGCMIRANDKMKRLQKAAKGGTLANESVEDSLLDLAVYSIIGLVLYREQEPQLEQVDLKVVQSLQR